MSKRSLVSFVKDPRSNNSVLFEDDGKVAYAYLRNGSKIVGDVWVYNCRESPATPAWTLPNPRSRMPFMNPVGYIRNERSPAVTKASDISCRSVRDGRELVSVDVLIHGEPFARLKPGSKPGWSRLASRDGPNAKALEGLR